MVKIASNITRRCVVSNRVQIINIKYAFAVAWILPEFLGENLIVYTAENIVKIEDVDPNKTFADLRVNPSMT
tara:strand:+ start:474 stop:689 length:216 start_codon:yes stop_codon:yes gene_type:complete